eukprot:TRINITY_DN30471_c0_g1_i1.p2 TRINITY_DN30471_c0_g1~~TRINITY_DN30471_c0_g1_i1.p2  ORF type:complete len:221 (+),score=32.18 TRINITY_DN30471_c0_g1_i1:314-976(+)
MEPFASRTPPWSAPSSGKRSSHSRGSRARLEVGFTAMSASCARPGTVLNSLGSMVSRSAPTLSQLTASAAAPASARRWWDEDGGRGADAFASAARRSARSGKSWGTSASSVSPLTVQSLGTVDNSAIGLPGPMAGSGFPGDLEPRSELATRATTRELHAYSDDFARATSRQRFPVKPARREDQWGRGWRSTGSWTGRRKLPLTTYADEVVTVLGKHVAVR